MTRDEAEGLAAEYVLGTLDEEARAAFVRVLADDPSLRKLVEEWEGRLGTLSTSVTPVSNSERHSISVMDRTS